MRHTVPLVLVALSACEATTPEGWEAPVELMPVAATIDTPLATWTLDVATVALSDVTWHRPNTLARRGWLPVAYAHPGHVHDDVVVGELMGTFDVDLLAGGPLGIATFVAGQPTGLDADVDALHLEGTVRRDEVEVPFVVDVGGPTTVWDVPVPDDAEDGSAWALALRLPAVLGMMAADAPADGAWAQAVARTEHWELHAHVP